MVGALCACGLDADSRSSSDPPGDSMPAGVGGAPVHTPESSGGRGDDPSTGGSTTEIDEPEVPFSCPSVSEEIVANPALSVETLSEILWNEPADDALLVRATHVESLGDLTKLAQFMLDDPRTEAGAGRFFPWWVTGSRLLSTPDASATAPVVEAKLYESMVNEVISYGADVLGSGSDGDAQALLVGPRAYVDEALFLHYGLGSEYEESGNFVTDERRFGVFSSGLFGVTHTTSGETSPPARGATLRAQLLCERVPGRPADLPAPRAKKKAETSRDYWTDVVLDKKDCQTCHSLTTEIGLGFEGLDALGRLGSEGEVDATTVFFGLSGEEREYDHPREWLSDLTENSAVWECFGTKWMEFLFSGSDLKEPKEKDSALDLGLLVQCSESEEPGPDLGLFLSQLLVSEAVQSSFSCEGTRCLEGDLCVLTGPAHSPTGTCVNKAPASCEAAKDCTCSQGDRGETYQDCTISSPE